MTNTVANAISKIDMDHTCNVSEDVLKGLSVHDYIIFKHRHLTRVLSKSLIDSTDLGTSVVECIENVSEMVEDIAFCTMDKIAYEQRTNAMLQQ